MIDVDARPRCATGSVLILSGAFVFASANAAVTASFRRGFVTIVTAYLIRCVAVYAANIALVALRDGGRTAANVALLRIERPDSARKSLARAISGSLMGVFLNWSFVLLTFADSFTIFKGVDTIATVVFARLSLGTAERLTARELLCGASTFLGILMIAQPPMLFGALATPRDVRPVTANGLALAVVAGALSAGNSVLTRVLTRAGGPHEVAPAMLLSHLLVVGFCLFASLSLAGEASGVAEAAGWEWLRFRPPSDATDAALLATYSAGVLAAQLLMAEGYQTTRAGIGAFLALTELGFVFALDALVLREPTSWLAAAGTAVVFAGATGVATG